MAARRGWLLAVRGARLAAAKAGESGQLSTLKCQASENIAFESRSIFSSIRKDSFRKREFCNVFRLHVYRDRVGGEGGFLESTIRMNLPKGLPLGFREICGDFWDFWRGVPEPPFLLLLVRLIQGKFLVSVFRNKEQCSRIMRSYHHTHRAARGPI